MKTILVSAYAVNPNKGSEDGMGWNFIRQIARFQHVVAITRENNREAIEDFFKNNHVAEAAHITFLYFDQPYWMRFWKKGSRGAMLYYLLWQMGLPGFVRRQKINFDIAHNLNFHNDWSPSFLWKLGKPFVWGPVGHHPAIPAQFLWGKYPVKEWITDRLRWMVKQWFWTMDPLLTQTRKKARVILAMNSTVQQVLKGPDSQFVTLPSVGTDDLSEPGIAHSDFRVIAVGRFVPLKGFDITIRAFAVFVNRLNIPERQKVRLTLVGAGPYLPMLRQIVSETKMEQQIEIIEWMPRSEIKSLYNNSNVFFFPSHEGAGMVVAEALSCSLPVICFDNSGPGEFVTSDAGIKVPCMDYNASVGAFADALYALFRNPEQLRQKSIAAKALFKERFDWNNKGIALNKIYERLA